MPAGSTSHHRLLPRTRCGHARGPAYYPVQAAQVLLTLAGPRRVASERGFWLSSGQFRPRRCQPILPPRPGGVDAALAADAGVVSARRVDAGHRNATNTPLCTPNSPRASVRRRRRLLARLRCFVVLLWCIAHHSPRPSWQDLRTANGCNSALRASLWHPWTSSRQLGAALRAGWRPKNLCHQVG